MTKSTIADLANEALDAFWEVVVRHNPQAKTGDLSPSTTITLTIAAQEGIEIEPDDFHPLLVTPGHHDSEPLFNK